jgi:hypothetical protein
MSKLVDFVAEKDAEQFRNEFLERISDKVVDCLENEKAIVAQRFFSSDFGQIESDLAAEE